MNLVKRTLVNDFVGNPLVPNRIRSKILRAMGLNIQSDRIRANCHFDSTNMVIGKNTFVNYYCQFYPSKQAKITIGDNCQIAMNVNICTITHRIGSSNQRAMQNEYYPITIGNGCWIGANATILPGVTIGDGCIIAAGAVVNKDCEPNVMYGGVPARRIKELDVEELNVEQFVAATIQP